MESSGFAQIENALCQLTIDPCSIEERQGLDHFGNSLNPRWIAVHGRPPAFHYASERSFAVAQSLVIRSSGLPETKALRILFLYVGAALTSDFPAPIPAIDGAD
jgi:hypothetical protein